MNFCCGAFRSNFEMAGTRGFGVFSVQSNKKEVAFIVQNRATEPGVDAPVISSPLSLISEMYISFCPWCGKKLDRIAFMELIQP
jgi:hypothetical protein